jgi:hypothetical protein
MGFLPDRDSPQSGGGKFAAPPIRILALPYSPTCLERLSEKVRKPPHERVYDGMAHSSSTFGGIQLMIEFFSTLVRLFKAIVGA